MIKHALFVRLEAAHRAAAELFATTSLRSGQEVNRRVLSFLRTRHAANMYVLPDNQTIFTEAAR